MPNALYDPTKLRPVRCASRVPLIQYSSTPLAFPGSFNFMWASMQYHSPTAPPPKIGAVPATCPSHVKWSTSLYPVVTSRSEERRVGKEGRSRWSPYHEKKKKVTR